MKNTSAQRLRLRADMTFTQVLATMSQGKPVALRVFAEVLAQYDRFELAIILVIADSLGIYGSDFGRLYGTLCRDNVKKLHDLFMDMRYDVPTLQRVKTVLRST